MIRLRRGSEAAACDREDAEVMSKSWSEVVENVPSISVSRQQQNGLARTTPVENFQVNARFNLYEMNRVFGWVFPIRCIPFWERVE
jgi:hypothetical protein